MGVYPSLENIVLLGAFLNQLTTLPYVLLENSSVLLVSSKIDPLAISNITHPLIHLPMPYGSKFGYVFIVHCTSTENSPIRKILLHQLCLFP